MKAEVQLQLSGRADRPTLIFLPGLHGNWKIIGGFRRSLADRVRFVEISYPNEVNWSLEDHAEAVENALIKHQIRRGWILAESFSSQVAWTLLARGRFDILGLVFAGGFVRHPLRWWVQMSKTLFSSFFFFVLLRVFYLYAWLTPFRFRRSPQTYDELKSYLKSLTADDVRGFKRRLDLVAQSDPRTIARGANVPIFAISGLFDPVVPWFWVRPWLKKNCRALREYRIIWRADHNVLGTAPDLAADQILSWMGQAPSRTCAERSSSTPVETGRAGLSPVAHRKHSAYDGRV